MGVADSQHDNSGALQQREGPLRFSTPPHTPPPSKQPSSIASHVQAIEACKPIRRPLPTPQTLPPLPAGLPEGTSPVLANVQDLYKAAVEAAQGALEAIEVATGIQPLIFQDGGMFPFRGGESAARARLSGFMGLPRFSCPESDAR